MKIRSPKAIRPWQHVIEPISGYLTLAEHLFMQEGNFSEPWNFGPNTSETKSVEWVINYLSKKKPNVKWKIDKYNKNHETGILKLDSTKSKSKLGWAPKWDIKTALNKTLLWYDGWKAKNDITNMCLEQIEEYEKV